MFREGGTGTLTVSHGTTFIMEVFWVMFCVEALKFERHCVAKMGGSYRYPTSITAHDAL